MGLGIVKPVKTEKAGPGLGIFRANKGANPFKEVQAALASTLGPKPSKKKSKSK